MRSSRIRSHRPSARLAAAALLALLAGSSGSLAPAARAESVVLTWTAPGDDGDVGQASQYALRFSTDPVTDIAAWWNGAFPVPNLPAPRPAGAQESFTVGGLAAGATYYFVLRAADEVPNWSDYSNVAVKTIAAGGGALATPAGFAAQPVAGGIRLTWEAVAAGAPDGYRLYRREGSGPDSLLGAAPISQTSWTDLSVRGGGVYEYRLVSYSGANESAPATVSIAAPLDLLATASTEMLGYPNPAKGKVTLRFHAGTADGAPGPVRLSIFDMSGHRVCALLDGVLPGGEHAVEWRCQSDTGNPVAPGLYTAILDAPTGRKITRLAIVP